MKTRLVEIGNNCCIVITNKPFFEYIDKGDFMKLSINDRKKVFLRWKHGNSNHEVNEAVEHTNQYLLSRITDEDLERFGEFDKWFWDTERKWESKCHDIKIEIGLVSAKQRTKEFLKSDTKAESVKDIFDGQVTDWEE